MKLTGTVFILLFALIAGAQIQLKANDPSIRYDLIRPAHSFSKVILFDSLGNKKMEFVNESVIAVDKNMRQLILSRFRQVPLGRIGIDTSIINPNPVSMHFLDLPLKNEFRVKFNATSVVVQSLSKGKRNTEVFKMEEGYFDDNILEDICGYLSFKKGIKYKLNCFRYESKATQGVNAFQIEYQFDDYLPGERGTLTECKVLRFINGYEQGFLWIDTKTNELVKEVATLPGNTTIYLTKI